MTDRWDDAARELRAYLQTCLQPDHAECEVCSTRLAEFGRSAFKAGQEDMRERADAPFAEWLRQFGDVKIDCVPADKYARDAITDIRENVRALPAPAVPAKEANCREYETQLKTVLDREAESQRRHDEAVEAALDSYERANDWRLSENPEGYREDMSIAIAAYEAAMLKRGWQWTKIVRRERPPLDLSDLEEAP